ncbi:MAG: hypothetical protein ACHP85_10400 [Burkholderiales bacterium]
MSEDEGGESRRLPWSEGPDGEAPAKSWLLLDDDELLHKIETLGAAENEDERLIEVVASNRHFFIRQEAAKRIKDHDRLFEFEDDRHVGQILVRYLTRREDLTYLQQLSRRSRHVEVRSAAQVQLARLWRRLDSLPAEAAPALEEPESPEAVVPAPKASLPASPAPAAPVPPQAVAAAAVEANPPAPFEPITSAALETGGVDGSLLAWAVHFLVQPTWSDVGTERTRELLTQTRRELLGRFPTLVLLQITADAHVTINLEAGPRLPADAVRAVAAWMVAYRKAVSAQVPGSTATSVRAATAMVADALRDAGFYTACDEFEARRG